MQIQKKLLFIIRVIFDLLTLALSYIVTSILINLIYKISPESNHIYNILFLFVVWFYSSKATSLYDEFRSRSVLFELASLTKNIISQGVALIILFYLIEETNLPKTFVLIYLLTLFASLSIEKYLFKKLLVLFRKKGRNLRNIIIVGTGKLGINLYDTISKTPQLGYRIIGFIDENREEDFNGIYLGNLNSLKELLDTKNIHDLIIALPQTPIAVVEQVVKICEGYPTRVRIIPNYSDSMFGNYDASMFAKFPMLSIREERINELHWRMIKRIFDFSFSLFVLMSFFSWVFPLIALFIKLDSKGPIFYKQKRWGRDKSMFDVYKFRTMKHGSNDLDSDGKFKQAVKNDSRVTNIGKFLRKSNIDELPQFLNVLKGEMSLVGPRPHPTQLNIEFMDRIPFYLYRNKVKPGITGWAQINGYRGHTKSEELMVKRVEHDIWYVENWSFGFDLQIILLSVWLMIKGDENAY